MARDPLFGHHRLGDGTAVSLRHPHRRDRAGVHELLRRIGVAADDLELRRALRFDPQRRAVVVATSFDGSAEQVVGLAAMDLHAGGLPDLLVAAPAADSGLRTLLAGALLARAAAHARRVA